MKHLIAVLIFLIPSTLFADDTLPCMAFRSFRHEEKYNRQFAEIGAKTVFIYPANTLCSLGIPYTQYPPNWLGPGKYDWGALDRQIEDILKWNEGAKVHVFDDQPDTLYANDRLIAIHSLLGGERTFKLKVPAKVTELYSKRVIASKPVWTFTDTLVPMQAVLYAIEPVEGEELAAMRKAKAERDKLPPELRRTWPEPIVELLDSGLRPEDVEKRPYGEYVRECLDNLMQYGTDRYGEKKTPVLVAHLDVVSRECPKDMPPGVLRRGALRICFWKPRGADMLVDQPTLRAFLWASKRTNDPKYADFARRYMDFYTKKLVDEKGFFWWGWHRFYDVFADTMSGSHGNHHEIHVFRPLWDVLWDVNPDATRRQLEAIRKWHIVDSRTGETNRPRRRPSRLRFRHERRKRSSTALAFLATKTNDDAVMADAKLVTDYYWNRRNKETNLVATRPNAGKNRFDGWHSDTTITGQLAGYLLKTYQTDRRRLLPRSGGRLLEGVREIRLRSREARLLCRAESRRIARAGSAETGSLSGRRPQRLRRSLRVLSPGP